MAVERRLRSTSSRGLRWRPICKATAALLSVRRAVRNSLAAPWGNLFTYTFGPQIKYRAGKFEPFAEVLLGGAHSNFYANACNKDTGLCGSKSPSNNAFALAIGGGIDIAVSEHFGIRLVDADYELTRFGNNFTGGNNSQSNFRFQTGVQFRF
jgi:opacity protein-like surface antigen